MEGEGFVTHNSACPTAGGSLQGAAIFATKPTQARDCVDAHQLHSFPASSLHHHHRDPPPPPPTFILSLTSNHGASGVGLRAAGQAVVYCLCVVRMGGE